MEPTSFNQPRQFKLDEVDEKMSRTDVTVRAGKIRQLSMRYQNDLCKTDAWTAEPVRWPSWWPATHSTMRMSCEMPT